MDAGRGDNCPDGFYADYTSSGKRFCRRTNSLGCTSIIYTTNGKHYTDILGSVRGYQIGTTDAFDPYYNNQSIDINGVYVDGVSITQGANRNHIWTYAAGVLEQASNKYSCPCTGTGDYTGIVPPFIYWSGSSTYNFYSCESGNSHGRVQYLIKSMMKTDCGMEVAVQVVTLAVIRLNTSGKLRVFQVIISRCECALIHKVMKMWVLSSLR